MGPHPMALFPSGHHVPAVARQSSPLRPSPTKWARGTIAFRHTGQSHVTAGSMSDVPPCATRHGAPPSPRTENGGWGDEEPTRLQWFHKHLTQAPVLSRLLDANHSPCYIFLCTTEYRDPPQRELG